MVFDIDGVLLRGYSMLPHARESLLRLIDANVPFILLTNGGGELESVKAAKLSKVLGLDIHEQQVVLSHTPLRKLCREQYANSKVLILGCRDVLSVARGYGLQRVYQIPDLMADNPLRYPFLHAEHRPCGTEEERAAPFDAVMILHDPNNWAPEIQITMDVIRGGWPYGSGGMQQRIPVYSSNPDIVFAGSYPVPRLAAGAFNVALSATWQAVCGTELVITQCGKPTTMTYNYAATQLAAWSVWSQQVGYRWTNDSKGSSSSSGSSNSSGSSSIGGSSRSGSRDASSSSTAASPFDPNAAPASPFTHIYMVGDNPKADIAGANAAGGPWQSVLVRTGVFAGPPGSNDAAHPARHVVAGVKDAVDLALSQL